MVWGWGEMSQLASTPRWKEILCVPRKCAPAQPGQSGGAGGWKAPLGSQYPCMGILLWPWIPLHQDDPWHRWESGQGEHGRCLQLHCSHRVRSNNIPSRVRIFLLLCTACTHPPRGNHSPRSPWQMSVLVAPPRINLGSLTMSWKSGSKTQTWLKICQENVTVTLSPDVRPVCARAIFSCSSVSHHKELDGECL